MAVTLKQDTVEENLTTSDVAQSGGSEERVGPKAVASERTIRENDGGYDTAQSTPLFPGGELSDFRNRWSEIQTAFVDEPRKAVEQADGLVASAMKRLAEIFSEERTNLEEQRDRGASLPRTCELPFNVAARFFIDCWPCNRGPTAHSV